MRFGINLRGDLAKLNDDALASHLEKNVIERKAIAPHAGNALSRRLYEAGLLMLFGRGPFHSRIFYRVRTMNILTPVNGYSLGDLYLLDCEIKDIVDEMKRRVRMAQRRGLPR